MSENIKKITEYLQENKSSFSRESLADTLSKAGYNLEDISQGLSAVYGNRQAETPAIPPTLTSFWDFQTKKTYFDSSEKWMDTLSGLAFSVVFAALSNIIPILGILFFYAAMIFLIVFFSNRRSFMTMGFAFGLIIGPIIGGMLPEVVGGRYLMYNSFF